ncbi:D-tyrosyl-tRNA(Tyr) deacylase [Candidatus Fermentibacteria bacterium]|nr:D-tyrosyl-tRNA(Tyr) deacylase [Candidatus Fermentibacteria bacterium]
MVAVIQRVSRAEVRVDGQVRGSISHGVLILVGACRSDTPEEAQTLARRIATLRIFDDANRLMNLSLDDVGGSILVISQFTLLANCRKGRRPSFVDAAPPDRAEPLVESFAETLRTMGHHVATGVFGAFMEVELVNDGPVTIILDTNDLRAPRRSVSRGVVSE